MPASASSTDRVVCGFAADLSRLNMAHANIMSGNSVAGTTVPLEQIREIMERVSIHNVTYTFSPHIDRSDLSLLVRLVDASDGILRFVRLNGEGQIRVLQLSAADDVEHSRVGAIIDTLDCNVPVFARNTPSAEGAVSQEKGTRDVGPAAEGEFIQELIVGGLILLFVAGAACIYWMFRRRQRRLSRRYQILQLATLTDIEAAHENLSGTRVMVMDISLNGLKLRHAISPQPEIGQTLSVEIGKHRLSGQIRWADDRYFGLEFVTPLRGEHLADIRRRSEDDLQAFEQDIEKAALAKLMPLSKTVA